MADQTTQSLAMRAAPEQIMAVIADFPAYPQWAQAVKTVEVLVDGPDGRAEQVRFGLDAGAFKDTYTLAYEWAGDHQSVSWTLVKGQIQKAQRGSYVLAPAPDG